MLEKKHNDMQQQVRLELQQAPKHQQQQMERQPSSDCGEEGFRASISTLMFLLNTHEDKQVAVAAALSAVLNVPRKQACQDPSP